VLKTSSGALAAKFARESILSAWPTTSVSRRRRRTRRRRRRRRIHPLGLANNVSV
jgi:hypothetical protein